MSGGSLDYVQRAMEDGEVDPFLRHADELVEYIDRVLLAASNGTLEGLAPHPEHEHAAIRVPYEPRAEALIALPAVRAAVADAVRKANEAQAALRDLANIAHAVDYAGSGDYGPDQVADAAVEWMRARLGMPKLPPWRERGRP